jgi:hypothetical protein
MSDGVLTASGGHYTSVRKQFHRPLQRIMLANTTTLARASWDCPQHKPKRAPKPTAKRPATAAAADAAAGDSSSDSDNDQQLQAAERKQERRWREDEYNVYRVSVAIMATLLMTSTFLTRQRGSIGREAHIRNLRQQLNGPALIMPAVIAAATGVPVPATAPAADAASAEPATPSAVAAAAAAPQAPVAPPERVLTGVRSFGKVPKVKVEDEEKLLASKLQRAACLISGGHLSKAVQALSSAQPVPCDPVIRIMLEQLHPKGNPLLRPCDVQDAVQPEYGRWSWPGSDVEKVREVLRKTCHATTPGPSFLTEELLAAICDDNEMARRVTIMIDAIILNELTEPVREKLREGQLIALGKPSSTGPAIRPIAMGEALLKLASRVLLDGHEASIGGYFSETGVEGASCLQNGVCVIGGAELIIHKTRAAVIANPTHCVLTIDAKNAFNTPDRNAIADALRNHVVFAPFRRIFDLEYGAPSRLFWKSHAINSSSGVRQGSVLGPLFFCAALQPILLETKARFPQLLIYAYMDDITLVGDAKQCADAFAAIRVGMLRISVEVNQSKCEVWCSQWGSVSAEGLTALSNVGFTARNLGGIKVLGAFIGSHDWTEARLAEKCRKLAPLFENIASMPLCDQFVLLRQCYLPLLGYSMRVQPPEEMYRVACAFDDIIRGRIEAIAEIAPMSDLVRALIGQPVSRGGVGITDTRPLSVIAYDVSKALALDNAAVDRLADADTAGRTAARLALEPDADPARRQEVEHQERNAVESEWIARTSMKGRTAAVHAADRERLVAAKMLAEHVPHSGRCDALKSPLVDELFPRFHASIFGALLRNVLRLPHRDAPEQMECDGCKALLSAAKWTAHVTSCARRRAPNVTATHHYACLQMHTFITFVCGLQCEREPSDYQSCVCRSCLEVIPAHLFKTHKCDDPRPGRTRGADLRVWLNSGKRVTADFTTINEGARDAVTNVGAMEKRRVVAKNSLYNEPCVQNGEQFMVLVVFSNGAFGADTEAFLRLLVKTSNCDVTYAAAALHLRKAVGHGFAQALLSAEQRAGIVHQRWLLDKVNSDTQFAEEPDHPDAAPPTNPGPETEPPLPLGAKAPTPKKAPVRRPLEPAQAGPDIDAAYQRAQGAVPPPAHPVAKAPAAKPGPKPGAKAPAAKPGAKAQAAARPAPAPAPAAPAAPGEEPPADARPAAPALRAAPAGKRAAQQQQQQQQQQTQQQPLQRSQFPAVTVNGNNRKVRTATLHIFIGPTQDTPEHDAAGPGEAPADEGPDQACHVCGKTEAEHAVPSTGTAGRRHARAGGISCDYCNVWIFGTCTGLGVADHFHKHIDRAMCAGCCYCDDCTALRVANRTAKRTANRTEQPEPAETVAMRNLGDENLADREATTTPPSTQEEHPHERQHERATSEDAAQPANAEPAADESWAQRAPVEQRPEQQQQQQQARPEPAAGAGAQPQPEPPRAAADTSAALPEHETTTTPSPQQLEATRAEPAPASAPATSKAKRHRKRRSAITVTGKRFTRSSLRAKVEPNWLTSRSPLKHGTPKTGGEARLRNAQRAATTTTTTKRKVRTTKCERGREKKDATPALQQEETRAAPVAGTPSATAAPPAPSNAAPRKLLRKRGHTSTVTATGKRFARSSQHTKVESISLAVRGALLRADAKRAAEARRTKKKTRAPRRNAPTATETRDPLAESPARLVYHVTAGNPTSAEESAAPPTHDEHDDAVAITTTTTTTPTEAREEQHAAESSRAPSAVAGDPIDAVPANSGTEQPARSARGRDTAKRPPRARRAFKEHRRDDDHDESLATPTETPTSSTSDGEAQSSARTYEQSTVDDSAAGTTGAASTPAAAIAPQAAEGGPRPSQAAQPSILARIRERRQAATSRATPVVSEMKGNGKTETKKEQTPKPETQQKQQRTSTRRQRIDDEQNNTTHTHIPICNPTQNRNDNDETTTTTTGTRNVDGTGAPALPL